VLLSKGAEKDVRGKLVQYEVQHVLLQGASSIAEEYQAKWTPAAVLIDRNGKIASPVTFGEAAIRALLTRAVATAEPALQTGRVAFSAPEAAAEAVVA
jgi:hypothetical protein